METKKVTNNHPKKSKLMDFWQFIKNFGAIIGFIGGLGGLYVTYHTVRNIFGMRSELSGKIISYATGASYNRPNNEMNPSDPDFQSIQTYNKVSISVMNEDFVYDEVIPVVKFKDGTTVTGHMMNPLKYTLTLDSQVTILKAPIDEMLIYNSVLYKNKNNILYVAYYVKDVKNKYLEMHPDDGYLKVKDEYMFPRSITFKFKSVENGKYYETNEMILSDEDIWKILFEPEIWQPIGTADDYRKIFENRNR